MYRLATKCTTKMNCHHRNCHALENATNAIGLTVYMALTWESAHQE